MNNAALIVETLRAAGVSHGFGVKQDRRRFGIYGTDLGERVRMNPPAHYFGVPVVVARSAAELACALKDALAAAHPTVIEAEVDPSQYLETVYD